MTILTAGCARLGLMNEDNAYCQERLDTVDLPSFPDVRGVIIPADHEVYVSLGDSVTRFTTSEEDILVVEKILHNDDEHQNISGLHIRWHALEDYNRQYIGFAENSGDKKVLVVMLDMSTTKARKEFEEWRCKLIVGGGGIYDQRRRAVVVKLSENKIDLP